VAEGDRNCGLTCARAAAESVCECVCEGANHGIGEVALFAREAALERARYAAHFEVSPAVAALMAAKAARWKAIRAAHPEWKWGRTSPPQAGAAPTGYGGGE
jgi:hypothetical protein